MIDIDRLHKGYRTADGGHSEVLRGLSLQVPARSVTAVVSPSGAGVAENHRRPAGEGRAGAGFRAIIRG